MTHGGGLRGGSWRGGDRWGARTRALSICMVASTAILGCTGAATTPVELDVVVMEGTVGTPPTAVGEVTFTYLNRGDVFGFTPVAEGGYLVAFVGTGSGRRNPLESTGLYWFDEDGTQRAVTLFTDLFDLDSLDLDPLYIEGVQFGQHVLWPVGDGRFLWSMRATWGDTSRGVQDRYLAVLVRPDGTMATMIEHPDEFTRSPVHHSLGEQDSTFLPDDTADPILFCLTDADFNPARCMDKAAIPVRPEWHDVFQDGDAELGISPVLIDVRRTRSGQLLLSGSMGWTRYFDCGGASCLDVNGHMWLALASADGEVLWSRIYVEGDTYWERQTGATAAFELESGGLLVLGQRGPAKVGGGSDVLRTQRWVLSASGELERATVYADVGPGNEWILGTTQTDGGVIALVRRGLDPRDECRWFGFDNRGELSWWELLPDCPATPYEMPLIGTNADGSLYVFDGLNTLRTYAAPEF